MGHGIPGAILITDVTGRKRWLPSQGGARVLRDRVTDDKTVRAHLEAASGLEKRGELLQAINSWIEALGALLNSDSDAEEERKVLVLAKIAVLAKELNLFEVGVEYNLQALELSIKQFSKDSINNFQLINNLGVLFISTAYLKRLYISIVDPYLAASRLTALTTRIY